MRVLFPAVFLLIAALFGLVDASSRGVASSLGDRTDRSAQSAAHPVDEFHPDRKSGAMLPTPAYGGRAIVHAEALPKSLCYTVESSAVVRRILYEMHETLLARDWETYEIKPVLCESYTVDDRIVLKSDAAEAPAFGAVTDGGDDWIVTPKSAENSLKAERRIAKSKVERVERGTVFTFRLKPGIRWHDGHEFDARDVAFSLAVYANPTVRCDDKRFAYADIVNVDVLGPRVVRVTYDHQYFMALMSVGDLFLLPSHLYDLGDPDNALADPEYHAQKKAENADWKPTSEEQGRYVNENVHNRAFVGLGPYALTEFAKEYIEARRFEGYFDPARGGYLDTLRWRAIPDTAAAFRAFLAGDLDFFDMVTTDDYFSSAVDSKEFEAKSYRGLHDTSAYWFVGWNCRRPKLADPQVRRALAYVFDFEEFKDTFYRGLARQVTGPHSPNSPAYDRDLEPYAFDERKASALLLEGGWYDRDRDGLVDKDGEPLVIELLTLAGNPVGRAFSAKYQENLKRVGIRLVVTALDSTAFNTRKSDADFDAIALGWAPPFESDPGQMFHSRYGLAEKRGSNFVGFADPECDRLIDAGRAELDTAKRAATWRAFHKRLYELQPYLFAYSPPRKFVMNQALRGFQSFALDPNYSLRRWYYAEGSPGTRARPDPSSGAKK